ncbi:MAG: hypothetical protein ACYC7D_14505 [Nitrososphaerales archaeon]
MDLRSKVWIIGAAWYVIGMLVMFYVYQWQGINDYGLDAIFATFGAFLVMGQAFLAVGGDKPVKVEPNTKNSAT